MRRARRSTKKRPIAWASAWLRAARRCRRLALARVPFAADEAALARVPWGAAEVARGALVAAGARPKGAYFDCIPLFEAYVGISSWKSAYDLNTVIPSVCSWEQGDREVLCVLVSVDGAPLTRSLRGAAR